MRVELPHLLDDSYLINQDRQFDPTLDYPQPYNLIGQGPEGPEVRTVATKLNQHWAGKQLTKLQVSADSQFADGMVGYHMLSMPYTLTQVSCKGKWLIFVLSKDKNHVYLLSHLRMTGRWHWDPTANHIRLILLFGNECLCLSDSRKMATMVVITSSQLQTKLASIGVDYLQMAVELFSMSKVQFETHYKQEFDRWYTCMRSGKRANWQICKSLMDQDVYSGIGNYLKAEILYKSRIRPDRLTAYIQPEEWNPLFYNILVVIYSSFISGGLTISDYWDPEGNKGTFAKVVYNCAHCPLGFPVVTGKFKDGRTTHWVPDVQK